MRPRNHFQIGTETTILDPLLIFLCSSLLSSVPPLTRRYANLFLLGGAWLQNKSTNVTTGFWVDLFSWCALTFSRAFNSRKNKFRQRVLNAEHVKCGWCRFNLSRESCRALSALGSIIDCLHAYKCPYTSRMHATMKTLQLGKPFATKAKLYLLYWVSAAFLWRRHMCMI